MNFFWNFTGFRSFALFFLIFHLSLFSFFLLDVLDPFLIETATNTSFESVRKPYVLLFLYCISLHFSNYPTMSLNCSGRKVLSSRISTVSKLANSRAASQLRALSTNVEQSSLQQHSAWTSSASSTVESTSFGSKDLNIDPFFFFQCAHVYTFGAKTIDPPDFQTYYS